jgi:hypothetical protein
MGKKIPSWASFIIGSALAEFDGTNKEAVIEKVRGTAVGGFHNPEINKPLWEKFLELIDFKAKYLAKKEAFHK